jgi:Protein of unknown function (DUF3634)
VIELVWLAILLGGALVAAWVVARPDAEFIVAVKGGEATARNGKVTEAFLATVADVCAEFGVATGEIRGVARGKLIALKFSSGLPEGARQRLRNWWAMSGWAAPGAVRRRP